MNGNTVDVYFSHTRFFLKAKFFGVIGTNNADDFTLLGVAMNLYFKPVWSLNEVPLSIDSHPRFKNLFWVVPEISHLAHAVVDFASRMGWDYVGFIHQNNLYGWRFDEQLKAIARNHSVCFYGTLKINSGTDVIVLRQLVTEFIVINIQIPVVIVALEEYELIQLLQILKQLPRELTAHLQLVALTTWGTKQIIVNGNEEITRGVITFQSLYKEDESLTAYFGSKEFIDDRRSVQNRTKTQNTLINRKNNTCDGDYDNCTISMFDYTQHSTAAAYANSVYAFTRVILDSYANKNLNTTAVDMRYAIDQLIGLKDRLRDDVAPFRKDILDFGPTRRVRPAYGIYNYQRVGEGVYRYVQVGHWKFTDNQEGGGFRGRVKGGVTHEWVDFKLNVSRIQWQPASAFSSSAQEKNVPISKCGVTCKKNEVMLRRFRLCCWFCAECQPNQIIFNNTCVTCQIDEKPSTNLRRCEKLPHSGIQVPLGVSVFIYFLMSLAFLLTFCGLALFVHYRDTHVIRASSRELNTIIFIGLLMWNSVAFFTLFRVTHISCFLRSTFLYLGYSMVYAPLLLKTNRIYRIFRNGKTNPRPPKAVSPLSQVLITVCLCSVQIMICLVRVSDLQIQQILNQDTIINYCQDDLIVFFINMVYILAIMAATTFYAFKTRHFPKNYNESKYIGFAMYITLFVSCMGVVTFFSIADQGYKTFIISLVCLVCSLTVFMCIFPKRLFLLIKGEPGTGGVNKLAVAKRSIDSDNTTSHTTMTETNEEVLASPSGKKGDFLRRIPEEMTIKRKDDSLTRVTELSSTDSSEPKHLWDTRRFSNISMLSIVRIQRNEEAR